MRPNDPPSQPPEDLPPLVQRLDAFQLPELVSPGPPEYIPRVLPVPPPPPHPGFWMACLWAFVFLLLINGVAIGVALVVLAAEILALEDKQAVKDMLRNAAALQESPLFVRALEWGMAVAEAASVLFGLLIVRLLVGRDWKRQLGLVRPRLVHVILVVLAAPAMMALGDVVHQAAKQVLPDLKGAETTMKVVAEWPWWFSVLVIGVGPGIGEELWCRGFLGRGLVGRYGFYAGVIFTSYLFGLLHVDPPHVVAACAMGFFLHYVYLTTRCLWLSMLLHFLNNSAAAVLSNNGVQRAFPSLEDLNQLQPSWDFLAAILFLLATVVWALYLTRTRLAATVGGPPTWQPPYPGAAAPPAGSGTVETIPGFAWLALLPVLAAVGTVAASVYLQMRG